MLRLPMFAFLMIVSACLPEMGDDAVEGNADEPVAPVVQPRVLEPKDLVVQLGKDLADKAYALKEEQKAPNIATILADLAVVKAIAQEKIPPYIDIRRMTSSTVGPRYRSASDEQKTALQTEFRTFLVNVYAGVFQAFALEQLRQKPDLDLRTLESETLPPRASPDGSQVTLIIATKVGAVTLRVQYLLIKQDMPWTLSEGVTSDWKLVDIGMESLWLVQQYKQPFQVMMGKIGPDGKELGIGGLIAALQCINAGKTRSECGWE